MNFTDVLLSCALSLVLASAALGVAPKDIDSMVQRAPLDYRFEPADAPTTSLRLAAMQDDTNTGEMDLEQRAKLRTLFGDKGTSRLDFHVGYGFEVKDSDNALVLAGAGYSYFIRKDFAIVLELNGLYIDQNGPEAVGVNLNLLLRYHFINEGDFTVYLDGGAGIVFFDDEVPAGASEFNFTPQLGVGFTYDIGDDNRLMAGVRWYHISNANTDPVNPGRDHAYFYAGLSLPF